MQSPITRSTINSKTHTPDSEKAIKKTVTADATKKESGEVPSQSALSGGGIQTRKIFGEAVAQQELNSRLKAELTQVGSRRILASSLMSRITEEFEISLPAERVEGGWKAKVTTRENGHRAVNLSAVRSDDTGQWTIMPEKMEAAGQVFSNQPRFEKSIDNPVQGPFGPREGAAIATKMLKNIAHLEGNDLVPATGTTRYGGEVRSAKSIMDAVKATEGIPGQVFVYSVSGEPAAVMKGHMRSDFDDSFHIDFVVSDPYARGAGTAMIEKAATQSLQNGAGGLVTLVATNAGAVKQYKKLGFETYSPFNPSVFATDLKLDPRTSDQWEKIGDVYVYNGDANKKYVTALGPRSS